MSASLLTLIIGGRRTVGIVNPGKSGRHGGKMGGVVRRGEVQGSEERKRLDSLG
jgi:hypothetical protein